MCRKIIHSRWIVLSSLGLLLSLQILFVPDIHAQDETDSAEQHSIETPDSQSSIELKRRRPGTDKDQELDKEQADYIDPNRKSGLIRVDPPPSSAPRDFIPIPDRWRLAVDLGVVKENWFDPYNHNILKADRPVWRDWFVNVSVISDSVFEPRSFPTPVCQYGSHGVCHLPEDRYSIPLIDQPPYSYN